MNKLLKHISLTIFALTVSFNSIAQQQISYDEAYAKANELMKTLTLDEKISMARGYSRFFINGIPDKGVPYIYLSDATQGVNMRNNLPDPDMVKQLERSVAFPAPIMLAATFNPDLAYDYAQAIGEECRAGGVEFLLGPGFNIYRNSQCGRNFEYFGEDPYLSSRMVEKYVIGMQKTGTAACLKHFVANNTEFFRKRSNSIVSERALNEIYMPAFKAGIDAGVASVMTSYNQLNGEWASQSKYVIQDLLRKQFGFRGLIMTDWNAVQDLEKVIKSGQNLEMPGTWDLGMTIKDLVNEGKVSEKDIEEMIRPIFATCIAYGLYDREKYKPELLSKLPEHESIAHKVAQEGIVLLSNNGILPLNNDNRKILLVGKFLDEIPRGAGAAAVKGYNNITLRRAFEDKFKERITCVSDPSDQQIKDADIVIVNVGTIDAEAIERPFNLPSSEEKFVNRILEKKGNTIILVNSGSGIWMKDWKDKAAAIIYGWYPGQNGFKAIADVVDGSVNPSGKLPMSIEKEFKDSPAYGTMPKHAEFYKEKRNEQLIQVYDVNYSEGVLVGYRWYETKKIEPLFPFGHGLSYTTFEISNPKLSSKDIKADGKVTITASIANTGKRDGAEVVQLYISEVSPIVERPAKELKGIRKIFLKAGEKKNISFDVSYTDLAYWNEGIHQWSVNPGIFKILLATSSADIKNEAAITAK